MSRYGDSASLRQALPREVARSGPPAKPVIFLDHNVPHVKALTTGLQGGRETGFRKLARWLGGDKPQVQDVSIVTPDLAGRSSTLHLAGVGRSGRGRVFERVEAWFETRPNWKDASIEVLERSQAQALVKNANWNVATDGVPSAVMIEFPSNSVAIAKTFDVGVVAGTKSEVAQKVVASLSEAGETARQQAIKKQASPIEVLSNLKNDIQALTDLEFERLLFVIREKQDIIHFTLLDLNRAISG